MNVHNSIGIICSKAKFTIQYTVMCLKIHILKSNVRFLLEKHDLGVISFFLLSINVQLFSSFFPKILPSRPSIVIPFICLICLTNGNY